MKQALGMWTQSRENGKTFSTSVLTPQNHAGFSWNVLQVNYTTNSEFSPSNALKSDFM